MTKAFLTPTMALVCALCLAASAGANENSDSSDDEPTGPALRFAAPSPKEPKARTSDEPEQIRLLSYESAQEDTEESGPEATPPEELEPVPANPGMPEEFTFEPWTEGEVEYEEIPDALPFSEEAIEEEWLDDSFNPCCEHCTHEDRCRKCAQCAAPIFRLGGWVDQGFTWNPDSPMDRSNRPVTFNDRANEYQLNQLYLFLESPVNRAANQWDVGGRVDLLYGTDFRFTTALGLEVDVDENGNIRNRWNSNNRRFYGLAMPQLYMEVGIPLAAGASVKLGHFYGILGYESVMAPANFFYSHSYARQYAEPFTHTGFLASVNATEALTFHGGMTRGWDTWEDNNNDLGQLYGISWLAPNKRTSAAFAIHIGREQDEPPSTDNNRVAYSLVLQHAVCDWMRYVVQHDLGFEDDGAPESNMLGDAQWAGVNQYLFVDLSHTLSIGLRAEWFRDNDGARVDPDTGLPADYFAGTLGLNWRPCQDVVFRPEVRYDFVEDDVQPFDDGTERNQILSAIDVIVRF